MCCTDDDSESSIDQMESSRVHRRPIGTRRRQLEWFTNFVLIIVSMFGCSIGAGLLGFYQLHLLSFVSYEFLIVPCVLLGGGAFTLLVSGIGLLAVSKRSVCLLRFYAFTLTLAFLVLIFGVAASIKVIFTIHVGINHSLAAPLMKEYGKNPVATYTFDNLQMTYRCCGIENSLNLGYMYWEEVPFLQKNKAVPDTCCLKYEENCGRGVFDHHDQNSFEQHSFDEIKKTVMKIHVHGCLKAMDFTLKNHVVKILSIFAISGTVLSLMELMGVFLACCLANIIVEEARDKKMYKLVTANTHLDATLDIAPKSMITNSELNIDSSTSSRRFLNSSL